MPKNSLFPCSQPVTARIHSWKDWENRVWNSTFQPRLGHNLLACWILEPHRLKLKQSPWLRSLWLWTKQQQKLAVIRSRGRLMYDHGIRENSTPIFWNQRPIQTFSYLVPFPSLIQPCKHRPNKLNLIKPTWSNSISKLYHLSIGPLWTSFFLLLPCNLIKIPYDYPWKLAATAYGLKGSPWFRSQRSNRVPIKPS